MTYIKKLITAIPILFFAISFSSCSPKVSKSSTSSSQSPSSPVQTHTNFTSPVVNDEKLEMGNEKPRSIPASTLPVERTQLIKK